MSDLKVVRGYIDGGYRACLLLGETKTMYKLAPVTAGPIRIQNVPKTDIKLTRVEDQSRNLASFRRLVGKHGAVKAVIEALELDPKFHHVEPATKKKTAKKKAAKKSDEEE